jgi:3-isopropylmalate/(R)-2-methylmalate dehydratase small subunit
MITCARDPDTTVVTVDLEVQQVTAPDGRVHRFEIDPHARRCLLDGLDELDTTLRRLEVIEHFEGDYDQRRPWVRASGASGAHQAVAIEQTFE